MIGLAIALTALAALATTSALTFAFLSRRDSRELLAARDMLDAERVQLRTVRGELDVETAAHAATKKLLEKETKQRTEIEAQRNQAFREARDQLVAKIKTSNLAEAERILADLLAAPLPGFVPEAVPEGRATAPGPDRLIDPFVQPAGDPDAGG